jgi:hypothetical protein
MTRLSGWLILSLAWILLEGCGTSHESLLDSLQKMGDSDLKDIIADLPPKAKGSILRKPYFVRQEYEEYHGDSSIVYQARATLIFCYLDPNLDLCQVRKYRYKTTSRFWDRYEVKLLHFPANFTGTGVQ